MEQIILVLIISVLGPIIGSAIGVMKKPSDMFIRNMLAFAAGVMLAISFLELIPESIHLSSVWIAVIGVLLGSIMMFLLDKLIPHIDPQLKVQSCSRLRKTSIYLIIGIFMHNFPEGMSMAIGAVTDFKVTLAIALAIAIHNIPEGICTSAPYYHCTKRRLKAFLLSSSTAIPILAGFILAYYIYQNISLNLVGLVIGATAGLMIYIASDELIPNSCADEKSHSPIFSLIAGVLLVILLGLL